MNDMKVISCTREIAGRNVTLETGKVARQATGSVIASSGDTKVLVTVVAGQDKSDQGFFPCLLYTSPSPRDATLSRMPSSA